MKPSSSLRIIFAGTPDFAVTPLNALIAKGFSPIAVLTQPDRKAGRGQKLQASPVKQAAAQAGLTVLQPENLKTTAIQQKLQDLQPDLMIVVAYGLILPQAVLDIPRSGCWNIHASLLPRWRGAAPIQRAIEAGDTTSGACIMQMDAGLDTGAVLARASIQLAADETGGSLHDRLADLGATLLLRSLQEFQAGQPPTPVPQAEKGVTYAHKLDKQEAQIDWQQSANQLEQRIRAFNPWPVCWCMFNGERTRIWQARAERGMGKPTAGTVIDASADGIVIACGDQHLRITQLQRPGGTVQTAREYLQSRTLAVGSHIETGQAT